MDNIEKEIHSTLKISSYKTLKEEGFYKKISPLSNFHLEYRNQYLQLTAYHKLFFAYKKLENLKKEISSENNSKTEEEKKKLEVTVITEKIDTINSFISNIFSVCDILSNQIYIVLADSLKGIFKVSLHKIANKEEFGKFEKNINLERFNKYFSKILEPINSEKSWYSELKYYRNQISHGMLMFTKDLLFGNAKLLKRNIYKNPEKFEKLVRNEPVHNKKPTKEEKVELDKMFNDDTIFEQFTKYFNNVKKLASNVWEKIHEIYINAGVQVDWKLDL